MCHPHYKHRPPCRNLRQKHSPNVHNPNSSCPSTCRSSRLRVIPTGDHICEPDSSENTHYLRDLPGRSSVSSCQGGVPERCIRKHGSIFISREPTPPPANFCLHRMYEAHEENNATMSCKSKPNVFSAVGLPVPPCLGR